MYYEQLYSEKQRIAKEIIRLKNQIQDLPEGKLLYGRNGKYVNWYQSINGKCTYLSKKKSLIAESLALKNYLTIQLEDLTIAHDTIEQYLSYHLEHTQREQDLLMNSSCFSSLLNPYFNSLSDELQRWLTDYEHNPNHPESLIHKTIAGHYVRSKSESMIATALYLQKIPYRYECALKLQNLLLYPDFMIRHPQTGEIYYWEHFGMMNQPSYSHNAFEKLQLYAKNGFIPSINLIATFETSDIPLDSMRINQIIQEYFLS